MAPSLPKSYKAAYFESKGNKLALKDVELKQPEPGYLLVKVLACGICHSDKFVQQGLLGDVFPRIPGHEAVGDVVAVGEGVTKFKGGERVGAAWHGGASMLVPKTRAIHISCSTSTNFIVQSKATMERAVRASEGTLRCATTRRSTA